MKKVFGLVVLSIFCFSLLAPGAARTGEQSFNWRMTSVWAEGFTLLESDRKFAQLVEEATGGRLKIKVFPVGQIGPANQVLDLVSSGAVDCGADWPNYWSGKNTAFDLLGSHVMGFTTVDYYNWIYAAGGKAFYDELYGKFNCVYFPHHMHEIESGIRSNKPINSLADFKGLKVRMAGLVQGKLLQPFGGQPVTLALNEVYEAMQRGVVDAAEISIPIVDEDSKIHEVAKYWLVPGFHQTSSVHGILFNKRKWEQLPDDIKVIVAACAQANLLTCVAQTTVASAGATNRMLASGVVTTRFSDAELIELEKARDDIMSDLAKQNPDYARLLKHQMEFAENFASYREFSRPWAFGRNWASYPQVP